MSTLRREMFDYNGHTYEIRVMFQKGVFTVAAFRDNYPANGFRHCLMIPKHVSYERVMTTDVIDEYITMAQDDIVTDRWERVAVMWNGE